MKRTAPFFLLLLLFLTASATKVYPQAYGSERILRIFESRPDRIMVAAHRGAHRDYPENSAGSIREAIRLGVDIVEIDVRITGDGVPVLMHDYAVDRTTNGTGKVSDMTLEQIRRLRLTHNGKVTDEVVPTFDELLEITKGRIMVDVDYKADPSYARAVCDAVVKAGMEQQVFFFLYDHTLIPAFKQMAPAIRIMPRANSTEEMTEILSLDKTIPVIHIDGSFYDRAFLGSLPPTVRIWSNALGEYDNYENTKEGLRRMLADMPGVNVIQTDNPAELIAVLKEGLFNSEYKITENDRATGNGTATVSGSVFNATGRPIIAQVAIHSGREYSPWRFSAIKTWMTDREGRFSFEVPAPGEGFRLVVSKGSEYEYLEIPFDVKPGHNTSIDVNLDRIIDDQTLRGWYAGDAHQHSGGELGSDGADSYDQVALHNIASGNSWGSLSEHRHMNSTEAFVNEVENLPTDFAGNGGRFFPLTGKRTGAYERPRAGCETLPAHRIRGRERHPPAQRHTLRDHTPISSGRIVRSGQPSDGKQRFAIYERWGRLRPCMVRGCFRGVERRRPDLRRAVGRDERSLLVGRDKTDQRMVQTAQYGRKGGRNRNLRQPRSRYSTPQGQ